MVSIIISSYRENLLNELKENIAETTTVPFEIIPVINHNEMSITQAYNRGAEQAQYDYLCFMHEDINIHTHGWDKKMIKLHQTKTNSGIIGVAGSKIKTELPTGWNSFVPEQDYYYVLQRIPKSTLLLEKSEKKDLSEVKVLDGLFLFTHRKVWELYPFDEKIEGFHLYDIDFSLRASQSFQNLISSEVLIEHYSYKGYNNDWIESSLNYHKENSGSSLFDPIENRGQIQKGWYYILMLFPQPIQFKNRWEFVKMMGVTLHSFPLAVRFLGVHRMPKKLIRLVTGKLQKSA